MYKSHIAKIVC